MKKLFRLNLTRRLPGLVLLVVVGCLNAAAAGPRDISLAGQWRFQIDRADVGIGQKWFERALSDQIKLPGTLTAQGVGDEVTVDTQWMGGIVDKSWFTAPQYAKYRSPGNVKIPFWLQPEKYYAGAAWFQRDFEVPKDWQGKRIVLFLERAHWETRVWVDGNLIGTNQSLSTPHEYDLGKLAPGNHTVSIRVDNRRIVDIGENSHGITDHTQGNWNGIVGKIELRATPLVWIENLQVYPNAAKKSVRVVVVSTNATDKLFWGKLSLFFEVNGQSVRLPVSTNIKTTAHDLTIEDEIKLGPDALLWDEFAPHLVSVRAELGGALGGRVVDGDLAGNETTESVRTATLGLRDVSISDTQITINGHKTFLRGTLECAVFPKTGHPPTEVAEWKRLIGVAKSFGLNLLRFHSYCPPEAAFQAADKLGMYLQVETCWANQSTTIGDGKPVDQWVYDETARILKAYGNHPSFILMLHGNEPGGKKANDYLARYVAHFQAFDSRRLWTSGAGWPEISENQFHLVPHPRVQGWGEGLKSRINARPPETVTDYRDYISKRKIPVVSHEIGQWCVYPNFDEIPKYTGYLKAKNFEIFRDFLDVAGMGSLAKQFLLASGKLQALCYKEEIESAFRTPGMGGFELLGLNDFPGQGTALVGVLDPFWDEKGYVTAKAFRRFCNAVVPLARLPKRVYVASEKLEADLELANFGAAPLPDAVVNWKLVAADGKVFAHGELPAQTIAVGNSNRLGHISLDLQGLVAPKKYQLIVGVAGTKIENDWDVWVYPATLPAEPSDVLVTSKLDDCARQRLQSGGRVLLTIPGQQVCNYDVDPVKLGFSSIFWNTAWTKRQPPTTLGILCDPKHPALAAFPSDDFSNWQWWYLIHRAGALRLDLLPKGVEPVVRVIDDWVTARPLGLVIEGRVGAGKIVVCGFGLTAGDADPVSRQMRSSLLGYMASKKFAPKTSLTTGEIQNLMVKTNAGFTGGQPK
ncbi:MAG: sugar-binding domain-containing protein [Verrucomicrobiota bacterium]